MKALYFDCFSGISGDMTLGALLDLGVDRELFESELKKLKLNGYDIIIEKKSCNGIWGTNVQVVLNDHCKDMGEGTGCVGEHKHLNEYSAEVGGHVHGHIEQHSHSERNLRGIELMIESSGLKQGVKDFSKKVFREIARAEAKVHNKCMDEIHFHEIGAVDSIIDIVGAAICVDLLGVDKVFSSPLHDGHGFIDCKHGIIPVPVPAVMEMLGNSGIPLISEDVNTELVTPTGMGLIKCLADSFGNMPAMIIDRVGYGMGKRHTGRLNALRITMGSLFEGENLMEEVALLETNIDDMSPELLGFASEKLLQSGALDVFCTPIYMKKSRPAVMLTVLCSLENEERLVDIILRETSTLGVRRSNLKRYCMKRETVTVSTTYGDARVKVASREDFKKFSPEYEDCREIAKRTGIPISTVYDMVCESYKNTL